MKVQAAIFDMDGLLLDTERVCMNVFTEVCTTLNLPFYEEVYLSLIGCNARGIEQILHEAYGQDFKPLYHGWRDGYDKIVKHRAVNLKNGVLETLNWLKQQHVPMAVATSTQKEIASIKLNLSGLTSYFDSITAGCEVRHGKPDPEIYLLAASRLGVNPHSCLAFEDSNNGVRAAVRAGMITYQIPDLVEPSDDVKLLGHRVRRSLTDVLDEMRATG